MAAETQERTAGPWHIDRDDRPDMAWNMDIVDASGDNRVCTMFRDGTEENDLGTANAEYIVKCCNSHPRLVEAVRRMVSWADDWYPGKPHPIDDLEFARAVLTDLEDSTSI